MPPQPLPITPLRPRLLEAATGRWVLEAPTGSGKSTEVPRWLGAGGRVLVVEPRRVACRALATRVASLEGATPGQGVGWVVRGERRAGADARIVFVTPGVALRMARDGSLDAFDHVLLDEFHERTMDVDLLYALLGSQRSGGLGVMSATVDGARIAAHLQGAHLQGEGRSHPVDVRYRPLGQPAPTAQGLEGRVLAAVTEALEAPGDVLVFLPGKAEISAAARALDGLARQAGLDLLQLHGGLALAQQGRVFDPGPARRVVLATNVAETSLTLPRIGVVVDSGLVRRTRYRGGRGTLTLLPIAADSAAQRSGRAGRLGPGLALRLWRADVRLAAATPPEVHRESLVPLVLAAAACGQPSLDLPFLDPPPAHALDDARAVLATLGAVDATGAVTPRGARLFEMPLDAHLGRLLVEAEARDTLGMVVPLVAALAGGRPLFSGPPPEDPADDLRHSGCDATALVAAVSRGEPARHGLHRRALDEARATARRLKRLWPQAPPPPEVLDRRALARTVLAAWPDAAHVARDRGRRVAWSNGGTELTLGRHSAVRTEGPGAAQAVLMLDSHALGKDGGRDQLLITAAMPVPLAWLVQAGLGRERLGRVRVRDGRVVAEVEQVYARKVLRTHEDHPRGALLRSAVATLVVQGRWMHAAQEPLQARHERLALDARLRRDPAPPAVQPWLEQRLAELGLEDPEDLALLELEDLLPPALGPARQAELDRHYPRTLDLGDARYHITYRVDRREAVLHQVAGARKQPPAQTFLPALPGWRLLWEHKNRVRVLRKRR